MSKKVKKSLRINRRILIAEMAEYERKLWNRNRYCDCGAECLAECTCDPEKKRCFKRRIGRKTSEKFRDRLNKLSGRNTIIEAD